MSELHLALVGNPNIGKTTLFNVLTGSHQKVGNWPGVTVEKKTGSFQLGERNVELVDLPGIYSLDQAHHGIDEQIARQYLESSQPDLIINLVDSANLRRNLQLTQQLRALGKPMIVVLNMTDTAASQGITIDAEQLSARLGVPVLSTVASKKQGVERLLEHIDSMAGNAATRIDNSPDEPVSEATDDAVIARFKAIDRLTDGVVVMDRRESSFTDRVDHVVLNRWLGIPIFLLVMYLLFTVSVNFGSVFIDFFDIIFAAVFVEGTRSLLDGMGSPALLTTLLADGVGGGITLVATFIPVIGFLYIGLSVLEDSGYMSRAGFVVDRIMSRLGLPGSAFVPLIVGFGCNVPAVMATRSMSRESDRLLTIAMAPFMSCGARLTVYVLFAAAFFPGSGQNMVFGLYLMGIMVAVLTGYIFRRQIFPNEVAPSIQEMPAYHAPILRNIMITTWFRLKGFISKAGKAIVVVVVVLSFLNSIGTDGSFGNENTEKSALSVVGKSITPLFSPIGVTEDNWPATVGLFTGMFAKEAIVGTLDALYVQQPGGIAGDPPGGIGEAIQQAVRSVGDELAALGGALLNPIGISIGDVTDLQQIAEDQSVNTATLTHLATLFPSNLAAFCYLSFILLYAPCVAVVGAIIRESGLRWAVLVFSWSTLVAYYVASTIYQLGTLARHPSFSATFIVVASLLMLLLVQSLKKLAGDRQSSDRIPALNV